MSTPWMAEGLVFIPETISLGAMIVLLLAGFQQFNQGYIGRVGIVGNVFLLWQILLPRWAELGSFLQLYGNGGTVVAVIAGLAYLTGTSLPKEFYNATLLFYSSLSILIAGIVVIPGI